MTFMSPRKAKAASAKAAVKRSAPAHKASPAPRAALASKAAPAAKGVPAADGAASAEATRLAAEIERAIKDGKLDVLNPKAVQALMAALCKLYGMQVEAGQD